MKEISVALVQVFAPLLLAVASAGIGFVARKVSVFVGLKNEKMLRDALHQSAENAVLYAVNRNVVNSGELMRNAFDYVKTKNPETLKRLGVSDSALSDIIRTKLPKP